MGRGSTIRVAKHIYYSKLKIRGKNKGNGERSENAKEIKKRRGEEKGRRRDVSKHNYHTQLISSTFTRCTTAAPSRLAPAGTWGEIILQRHGDKFPFL